MQTINLDEHVRPIDAARAAGISKLRIIQLITAGELEAVWTPLGRLVRRDSLERLIEQRAARSHRDEAA